MNLKTTFALAVLALIGGAAWVASLSLKPSVAPSETLDVLSNVLTPEHVTRIEVKHGPNHVVLEHKAGGEWTLPGNWPARRQEVAQLVDLVTSLRSRFAPIPLAAQSDELKAYGLESSQVPVLIRVRADGHDYRLQLGEEPATTNRFSRPTYLRLNDNREVIRLGPNLAAALDRPASYYQQRRLFPAERAKDEDSQDRKDLLVARGLTVKSASAGYTIDHTGNKWTLKDPVYDRVNPDKLKTILAAVPDIWAEQFVSKDKDLGAYGLKDPEEKLQVVKPDGTVTLLLGKQSQTKTRTVTRPPVPNPQGLPGEPQKEIIHDEYRFAKLQDNDQLFEVRADKLKDLFVAADTLRDARLARFRAEDARRVAIKIGGQEIVLCKEKEQWKVQKPFAADAELSKVNDLLDKLALLQARDKDVIDKADLKTFQLDPPLGSIKVDTEETKGQGDAKTKTPMTFAFELGKEDKAKSRVYVRVEGWPRVNAVEDSLMTLVRRPALVYRSRRVLDFAATDLAKIEVRHGKETFVLDHAKDAWRLESPVHADADAGKTGQLASDLGRLEAVEFISDEPKQSELDSQYGLGKPELSVTLNFGKADKPAQTLLIGKQRGDKPEYFAKLASASPVFVVKKELRESLAQSSVAFRPLNVWQIPQDEIVALYIQKAGEPEDLKRVGTGWQVAQPFTAPAVASAVEPLVAELATLRAEHFEAITAKGLGTYGLDKPFARVAVATKPKAGEATKAAANERVLLIGQRTSKDAKTRFAKLAEGEAVFVIGQQLAAAVERSPLELLDRHLLTLDPKAATRIESSSAGEKLTLVRDKEHWRGDGSAKFEADAEAMAAFLGAWSNPAPALRRLWPQGKPRALWPG